MFNFFKKAPKAETPVTAERKETWLIDKQFGFDYGHRVWSQQLNTEYSLDCNCVCRHLHGHRGQVHVFLEADKLERGMVTDFKHLNWLKNFLDNYIDHKFVLDLSDPWFINIINAEPIYEMSAERSKGSQLRCLIPRQPLNTSNEEELLVDRVYVPGTNLLAGYTINVSKLSGPEQEFFEGFFLVDFLPTSENLSKWLFECVDAKMKLINVKTKRIDWFETPKSRSSYERE